MTRREFIATGASALTVGAQSGNLPIIDTHIHLYDPSRPQGVPWPPKSNTLIYKTTLPSRFREVTRGLGVVGAVEVECSPWLEDNQWVLDVSANEPVIVGTVGNLDPADPGFRNHLERFAKNPLFRGIRHGYLWDRNPGQALQRPEFIRGLRDLAAAGLCLDTANPSLNLLQDVVRIGERAPDLRIVIDHLDALYPPGEAAQRARYDGLLRELRKRPHTYAKFSAALRMQGGKKVPFGLDAHKPRLDLLYESFGPDRVLYGSDWPNSDPSAPYGAVLALVQEYFSGKGREAAEKYFWRNSAKVYRWRRRNSQQPDPGGEPKA